MDDKKDQDSNNPEDKTVDSSGETVKNDNNQPEDAAETEAQPASEDVSEQAEADEAANPVADAGAAGTNEEKPAEQPLQAADKTDENSYEQLKSSLEEQSSEQSDEAETGKSDADADSDSDEPIATGAVVTSTPRRFSGKGWLKFGLPLAILLLLLLAATYVFAFYLPNRPAKVYESSLSNTGKALDKLVAYSKQQQKVEYRSVDFTGSLKYGSGIVAEANLDGVAGKDGNGKMELNIDAVGQKFKGDLVYKKQSSNKTPDIYFKATGIKQMLKGSDLAKLDGQWVAIDHTVLESMQSQLESSVGVGQNVQAGVNPTVAQANDAIAKLQKVNRKYIFTTNTQYAVLTKQKFIGKEIRNGRAVYHYKVSYNKKNLKSYLDAAVKALDASQLNDWSKQNYDKNISQQLSLEKIKAKINKADANYKFDLWADKQTRLVQSVKFTDFTDDDSTYFAISQNYSGGDAYPLSVKVGKDNSDGSSGVASFTATINTVTNSIGFELSADNLGSKGTNLSGKFEFTPSNKDVKVTIPEKTMPIEQVLQQTSLFSLLSS